MATHLFTVGHVLAYIPTHLKDTPKAPTSDLILLKLSFEPDGAERVGSVNEDVRALPDLVRCRFLTKWSTETHSETEEFDHSNRLRGRSQGLPHDCCSLVASCRTEPQGHGRDMRLINQQRSTQQLKYSPPVKVLEETEQSVSSQLNEGHGGQATTVTDPPLFEF